MHEVRVIAPAKVNLALRVGATRPDGYHPLETVFEALDLSDEIVAEFPRMNVTGHIEPINDPRSYAHEGI